ncbi:MAG: transporter substrate-binding protein [Rhodospirillales bacterium]|jgi:NitT/TauT family transport system substrate-binding protein|nr:transporter substrate-binding protein [Rhodospirillales bacterium]
MISRTTRNWRPRIVAALLGALSLASLPAVAETKLSITRQPGIPYLPTHVIEKEKLIEKHAKRLGVNDLVLSWLTFSGGSAATDALLSGNVDVLNTGVGNLLLLWDRTKGGVKGIVACSAQPMALMTRDPKIQSLKDYGPADKIAVPTVKVSTQAILLQIASAKQFGADQWGKLDPNTVQLGHPDAYIALTNPSHEVKSHFTTPPYAYLEQKNVSGARAILTSKDVIPEGLTQAHFFTTTTYAEANPKVIEAIKAATLEALQMIRSDPRKAVETYREISNDKTPVDELLELLKQPGMMDYDAAPHGTMRFAEHLFTTGTLKTKPASWKDYYLPVAHDLAGS